MKKAIFISILFFLISCKNQERKNIDYNEKKFSHLSVKNSIRKLYCNLPYSIKDDKFVLYYYPTEQYQNKIEKQGGEDYWLTILDDNTYELDSIYLYLISKKIKCVVTRIDNFPYCIYGRQDTLKRCDLEDSLFGFLFFDKNNKPIQLNSKNLEKYF